MTPGVAVCLAMMLPGLAGGQEADEEVVSLPPWSLRLDAPSKGRLRGNSSGSAVGLQLDRVETPNADEVALFSEPVPLEPKFEYTLSFKAKASAPRPVKLAVVTNDPSALSLADPMTLELSTAWTSAIYFFRIQGAEASARIQMILGQSSASVDFKEIKLTRRPMADPVPQLAQAPPRWTLGMPPGFEGRVSQDRTKQETLSVQTNQSTPKDPWQINIVRAGYTFRAGQEYVARFRARAAQPRVVEFLARRDRAPWTMVAPPEEIPISTQWETFELPFECLADEPRGMVQFNIGQANTPLQIEGFELFELPPPENLDQFQFRRNTWRVACFEGNEAKLIRPIHGGSVLRIQIDRAPTLERWHVNLIYAPVKVADARDYVLRFRVRAEGDRVLSFRLDDSKSGESVGLFKLIPVSASWQEIEVPFRSIRESNDARLIFELGGSDIDVEVSNVTLAQAPASVMSLDRTRTFLVNILAVSAAVLVVAFLVGRDFRRRRQRAEQAAALGKRF
jgi:hypothetical protein